MAYSFQVFLTHDWGIPPDNHRDNHLYVGIINRELKKLGIITWFDEDRMEKNVLSEMSKGLTKSHIVIVFVTRRYIVKVNGDEANDNCMLEFQYALKMHSPSRIIPVVMETEVRDTNLWFSGSGILGFIANELYIDMSGDLDNEAYRQPKITKLKSMIEAIIAHDAGKGNVHTTLAAIVDPDTSKRDATSWQEHSSHVFDMSKLKHEAFAKGMRKLSCTNGVYVGLCKPGTDIFEGFGSFTYANGDVYEGEWKDGKSNGHGTCTWADGSVYEGEWKDDKSNGHGTYTYADGSVYEGEWKDGKSNGHGTYKDADGSVYEGEYKDDKSNGHGVCTYADGSVYEGEWKDGYMEN